MTQLLIRLLLNWIQIQRNDPIKKIKLNLSLIQSNLIYLLITPNFLGPYLGEYLKEYAPCLSDVDAPNEATWKVNQRLLLLVAGQPVEELFFFNFFPRKSCVTQWQFRHPQFAKKNFKRRIEKEERLWQIFYLNI